MMLSGKDQSQTCPGGLVLFAVASHGLRRFQYRSGSSSEIPCLPRCAFIDRLCYSGSLLLTDSVTNRLPECRSVGVRN